MSNHQTIIHVINKQSVNTVCVCKLSTQQLTELFDKLLDLARTDFKTRKSDRPKWSPSIKTIHYKSCSSLEDLLALLHEIGHAKSNHQQFYLDTELIEMEIEAWQWATKWLRQECLLDNGGCSLVDRLIRRHINSYQDWQTDRATCNNCLSLCPQNNSRVYKCINCSNSWFVDKTR